MLVTVGTVVPLGMTPTIRTSLMRPVDRVRESLGVSGLNFFTLLSTLVVVVAHRVLFLGRLIATEVRSYGPIFSLGSSP